MVVACDVGLPIVACFVNVDFVQQPSNAVVPGSFVFNELYLANFTGGLGFASLSRGGGGHSGAPLPKEVIGNFPQWMKDMVTAGFQEALRRLENPNCAKIFDPDGSFADPVETLKNTIYRILPMPKLTTGAATVDASHVFINSSSYFFKQNLYDPATGRFGFYDFGTGLTGASWDALLLLHELGHQTGVFGNDAGPNANPDQNRTNTRTVLDNCFKSLRGGLYR